MADLGKITNPQAGEGTRVQRKYYLTPAARDAIVVLAEHTGRSQSEVINFLILEAVAELVDLTPTPTFATGDDDEGDYLDDPTA